MGVFKMTDMIVPELPESVSDATVAAWYKSEGESVTAGETLIDLETDKVMLELEAEVSGVLGQILKPAGSVVVSGELLGVIQAGEVVATVVPPETQTVQPAVEPQIEAKPVVPESKSVARMGAQRKLQKHSPTVRRLLQAHQLTGHEVMGTGKAGRLTKEDVQHYLAAPSVSVEAVQSPPLSSAQQSAQASSASARAPRRVPMSRLRARVAERLGESQKNAVILTTFNEVDMSAIMTLRKRYQPEFQAKHEIKLGLMSFFVRATVEALKAFPIVNASVEGQDILYHEYFDLGVAIASPRGLVVPVIRDVDQLSMAEIERSIKDFAMQAKDNKLTVESLTGGTFTVTNGGTFGSMLSTPIINPPQSAILGMHNMVKRPVVVDDQVVIRPMMYLALSYDHRIIDGSDSVRFLVMIKDLLEDPTRLILGI
jgi:2-oxoglutarate dehydrogenase E2 component (dihydrolipoamide succinyltransferase)